MQLNWGLKTGREDKQEHTRQDIAQNGNFITLDRPKQYLQWPEKRPTHDAVLMCNAIKSGKLNEYLEWLEKRPRKNIISKILGIICSKSAELPILCDEEMPSVRIAGISFDPIQNIQARMMTKITLLLLIESESQKLGIWDQIGPQWGEKYDVEIKTYVQLLEALIQQCENSARADKIPELRHSIELIKDSNRQYAIDW